MYGNLRIHPVRIRVVVHSCGCGSQLIPDSILLRIFRAHWTKASSTFSPVRALVSRNISSVKAVYKEQDNSKQRSNNSSLVTAVSSVFIRCLWWKILPGDQLLVLPFSWAKREASRNVTSLSASRSFLFPHRMMTMFWLASILASLSHVVRALYVSRLQQNREIIKWQLQGYILELR